LTAGRRTCSSWKRSGVVSVGQRRLLSQGQRRQARLWKRRTLLALLQVQILLFGTEALDGADRDGNVEESELAEKRLEALLLVLPVDLHRVRPNPLGQSSGPAEEVSDETHAGPEAHQELRQPVEIGRVAVEQARQALEQAVSSDAERKVFFEHLTAVEDAAQQDLFSLRPPVRREIVFELERDVDESGNLWRGIEPNLVHFTELAEAELIEELLAAHDA
jgi:hypothetical protein